MTTVPRPGWVRLVVTPIVVAVILAGLYLYIQNTPGRIADVGVLNERFISSRLIQHLEISGISFALAALVGLPIGVLLAGAGRVVAIPVFLVANLGQAVPSIGILALGLTFFGLGIRGPVTALVLYALLPILRNTLVGVQGVDPAAVEAARGMGMTPAQTLVRVQLPLASPVIFAGLRVALVLVVGTATLANFVGGGGLGDLINSGNLYHPRPTLVGAVIVSALALLADWALGLVERAISPRT
ncbi:MAG: osmoprotectant transport system permease protein [Chloroflexota bacterium]|jgi:osmoprotectant transport system permease protein|nr:osmoprotectant transport system permease protein [Chloroflexota bacterium]